MARIRTIKPEFFTSEDIVSLSPMARLLYIALWCEADREGRMAWKPRTFKMRYLPADNCDVDALCRELIDARLVVMYGDGLAYIPKFRQHQHLNPREAPSNLPDPHASATRAPRVEHASVTVEPRDSDTQGGREGKGREGVIARVVDASSVDTDETHHGESKEPKTRSRSPTPKVEQPPGVTDQVWTDWLALRRAKKAPVTPTVIASAVEEAQKAGMTLEAFLRLWCSRGSQGLQADWITPSERGQKSTQAAYAEQIQ